MEDILVFKPIGAGGEVDVTSTAATTTVRVDPATTADRIQFVNHGSVKCRVRLGLGALAGAAPSQTAVTDTTGFVLLPGIMAVFRLDGATGFSVKTESGTTDLNWQLGEGA